jgi:hypothetical protein
MTVTEAKNIMDMTPEEWRALTEEQFRTMVNAVIDEMQADIRDLKRRMAARDAEAQR